MKPLFAVLVLAVASRAQSTLAAPKQSQTALSSKVDTLQGDLRAVIPGLNDDGNSLSEMGSSLRGTDADNAISLADPIQLAISETGGALWLIEAYSKMVCDQDKGTMKGILQDSLKFYSHVLDLNIDAVSRELTLTRLPAVSQVALRAQDRMRIAKRDMQLVLDAIQ